MAIVVITDNGIIGVPAMALGPALNAFDSIRVTVDRSGLRIHESWLARPVTHVPVDQIVNASAIDLKPTGWGAGASRAAEGRSGGGRPAGRAGHPAGPHRQPGSPSPVDDAATGAGLVNDRRGRVGR